MSRTLTAGLLAELSAGTVRPVVFVAAEFASGTSYLWTGLGNIVWDGHTWSGAGDLLKIEPARETVELRAETYVATLSGIKSAYLSLALQSIRRGKPLRCWLGFLDSAGAVIADPAKVFEGRVDAAEIEEGRETSTITLTAETRLVDLRRPRMRRYTPQDQQQDYPGDKGFDFVPYIQNWSGEWGRAPAAPTFFRDRSAYARRRAEREQAYGGPVQ